MTQSLAESPQLPLGGKTRRAWQAHARSRDDELRPDTDRLPVRSGASFSAWPCYSERLRSSDANACQMFGDCGGPHQGREFATLCFLRWHR